MSEAANMDENDRPHTLIRHPHRGKHGTVELLIDVYDLPTEAWGSLEPVVDELDAWCQQYMPEDDGTDSGPAV